MRSKIFEIVQHEQGALNLTDFLQSYVDLVLPFIGSQLMQHYGGRDMAGLDRRHMAQHIIP